MERWKGVTILIKINLNPTPFFTIHVCTSEVWHWVLFAQNILRSVSNFRHFDFVWGSVILPHTAHDGLAHQSYSHPNLQQVEKENWNNSFLKQKDKNFGAILSIPFKSWLQPLEYKYFQSSNMQSIQPIFSSSAKCYSSTETLIPLFGGHPVKFSRSEAKQRLSNQQN